MLGNYEHHLALSLFLITPGYFILDVIFQQLPLPSLLPPTPSSFTEYERITEICQSLWRKRYNFLIPFRTHSSLHLFGLYHDSQK